MKKILLLSIFLALSVCSVQSQVRFGARGGLTTSDISGITDSKSVSGFFIGPSIEAMINERFGVEASVIYSQKGIKFKEQTRHKTSYIEVPLNLKVAIPIGYESKIKPFLYAGPYTNFKISGDKNFDSITGDISDQWKTKSFSAGLNFGAGVELLNFLQIGVNYGLGLTNNYKRSDGNYSVKDRTWGILAAVYF